MRTKLLGETKLPLSCSLDRSVELIVWLFHGNKSHRRCKEIILTSYSWYKQVQFSNEMNIISSIAYEDMKHLHLFFVK